MRLVYLIGKVTVALRADFSDHMECFVAWSLRSSRIESSRILTWDKIAKRQIVDDIFNFLKLLYISETSCLGLQVCSLHYI